MNRDNGALFVGAAGIASVKITRFMSMAVPGKLQSEAFAGRRSLSHD
jgi:hypothetical protein